MKRSSAMIAVSIILLTAGVAAACPMCKDSLANGDATGAGALPAGFNTSIEIMLGGFFGVVSLVAGIIWRGLRG